jgi:hypothetical protein
MRDVSLLRNRSESIAEKKHQMINSKRQSWTVGQPVKIGFMQLRVIAGPIATPGNRAPDEYALESINGGRYYRFTPHHGVFRCDSAHEAINGPANV